MSNNDNPTYKLSKNKKALKWLRKHKNDPVIGGEFSACTPFHNYTKIINMERKPERDALQAAMQLFTPEERKLAKLFLKMPPRDIAKHYRIDMEELYYRLRCLREKALKEAQRLRTKPIHGNSFRYARAIDLETAPELVARRQVTLKQAGKVATCYLVERDNSQLWVDAAGVAFSGEIQDVLNNLEEESGAFEHVEVEE